MRIKKINLYIYKVIIIFITIMLFLYFASSIAVKADTANNETVKLTGYLIDEHCFAKKNDNPGADTKNCLLMEMCIKGGYGIAVPQDDGSYKFYYFNGKFFNDVKALDGTEGQKIAYDLITASSKEDHLLVNVTGKFEAGTKESINLKGVNYPVIDVINLVEATEEEASEFQKKLKISDTNSNSTMEDDKACGNSADNGAGKDNKACANESDNYYL